MKRKLNLQNKNKIHELKGSSTTLEIRKYFYEQIRNINFDIYSIGINKKHLADIPNKDLEDIYNQLTKRIINKISFEKFIETTIEFTVDKSKGKEEIKKFNSCIKGQIESKVTSDTLIRINHCRSHEHYGLQACDLFSYGIFLKYEKGQSDWYQSFEDRIVSEEIIRKEDVACLVGLNS